MWAPFHDESPGLTFLDDDHLIVHEIDQTGEFSSRVGVDASSPFRLHASFFEAGSGRLAFSRDWATTAQGWSTQFTTGGVLTRRPEINSAILVAAGGVLVRTGTAMKVYSKDFVEVQRIPLPQSDQFPVEAWLVSVSTSGKTVLLNHYDQKQSHFDVLDGSTFELRKSWNQMPLLRHLYSISDREIIAATSDQTHLLVGEFGSGQWKALNASFKVGCASTPTFVTDKLLVIGSCNELSVFSEEGESLMTDRSQKHWSVEGERTEVARNGRVIAVSLVEGKGGGFFDTDVRRIGNQIAVYDLSSRERVLTVDVVPLPKNAYDFALSPDGSKLAILNDRKVSVCSVPAQSPAH